MDQKWIGILVILVFYQKMTLGAGEDITVKEEQSFDIKCEPSEVGSMIIWFRVLDKSGMEFIASFSNNGIMKTKANSYTSIFSNSRIQQHILTLQSFNKDRDSGAYTCASLYKGNELKFGQITRLVGEKKSPQTTTAKQNPRSAVTPCACTKDNKKEKNSSLVCAPLILGPLAGGCGLLLLLLIITILYCNQIRTRRCPHHHKRKPRMAPGKQVMTNRHV